MEELRICTWNILADSYSHGLLGVPLNVILWKNRLPFIQKCLQLSQADIICLQEADHYEDSLLPILTSIGYSCQYLQRPQRHDGCLLAYKTNKIELIETENVFMDDLASMIQSIQLRENFMKQNVALMAKFRSLVTGNHFLIATVHVYWNPQRPEVKNAQCKYLIERIERYLHVHGVMPVIVTGDFNSMPDSDPYSIMTKKIYDASSVIHTKLKPIEVAGVHFGPTTKFLCDQSLIRLCRWMRALGFDVAIDDSLGPTGGITPATPAATPGAIASTHNVSFISSVETINQGSVGNSNSTASMTGENNAAKSKKKVRDFSAIFDRARREGRVILTTSRQMKERAMCPQYFFVSSERMANLESVLAEICIEFGLELDPHRFLTVCGKCGGEIAPCTATDPRISQMHVPEDKQIYICLGCLQGYWWDERENSSPARAMKLAGKLYATVLEEIKRLESAPATFSLPYNHVSSSNSVSSSTVVGEAAGASLPNGTLPQEVRSVEDSGTLGHSQDPTPQPPRSSISRPNNTGKGPSVVKYSDQSKKPFTGLLTSSDSCVLHHGGVHVEVPPSEVACRHHISPSLEAVDLNAMMRQRDNFLLAREKSMPAHNSPSPSLVQASLVTPDDLPNLSSSIATGNQSITGARSTTINSDDSLEDEAWLRNTNILPGHDFHPNSTGISGNAINSELTSNSQTLLSTTNSADMSSVATAEISSSSTEHWLQSSFVKAHGQEPAATNWGYDFLGTLDYIFVSAEIIAQTVQVIPQVTDDCGPPGKRLPQPAVPQATGRPISGDSAGGSTPITTSDSSHTDSKPNGWTSSYHFSLSAIAEDLPDVSLPTHLENQSSTSSLPEVHSLAHIIPPIMPIEQAWPQIVAECPQPSMNWPSDHFMILADVRWHAK